jgi:hypothetical protein
MTNPPRSFKIGSVVWAILIGIGFVCLGVSIMLPSTKRARFDHRQLKEQQVETDADTVPSARSSTQP